MRYSTFLKKLKVCPFCKITTNRILAENEKAILTFSQAPYHKHHLLVIPKRHSNSIVNLGWDENVCIMALVVSATKLLKKLGHDDCVILEKDGNATGKSIPNHLHYHVIPGAKVKDVSVRDKYRVMLTEEEEDCLRQDVKEFL